MDWQTPEDSFPTDFITDAQLRALLGRPPITGGWREGDPVGNRKFANLGPLTTEARAEIPHVRMAYETFGEQNADASNVILVFHALTGDSHLVGDAGRGHATDGWWAEIVGPGKALDTDQYQVIAPNVLGGCQGTTGPASLAPDGHEWGGRFPYLTIRDQVLATEMLRNHLGIEQFAAVVGGSMGGMHALEYAIMYPGRLERLAVIAAPPVLTADQIGFNLVQLEAIRSDPYYRQGNYYDSPDGMGPHNGLATARRMALLNYRSKDELNARFGRSWQSARSPLGNGGRFAVESYLDFHGNKFTRRFDAGSYLTLVEAMNSHDVGRGRGGVEATLNEIEIPTLILGITTDRLFSLEGQEEIAKQVPGNIDGNVPAIIDSPYGHDAFLIEFDEVGEHLSRLLQHGESL